MFLLGSLIVSIPAVNVRVVPCLRGRPHAWDPSPFPVFFIPSFFYKGAPKYAASTITNPNPAFFGVPAEDYHQHMLVFWLKSVSNQKKIIRYNKVGVTSLFQPFAHIDKCIGFLFHAIISL